jgi:hypothetical protein
MTLTHAHLLPCAPAQTVTRRACCRWRSLAR